MDGVVNDHRSNLLLTLHTHLAVSIARGLARLRPGKLEKIMRTISRGARAADWAEVHVCYRAVVTTSARCAGRWCLQRSIAVALLCRMKGSWPEWQTGACLMPFRAHAWVSVDGVPVGEDPALVDYFRPVLQVGPAQQRKAPDEG